MKKLIILAISVPLMLSLTACWNDYLDKAPESGLNTEDVFSKYENFKLFFNAVYEGTSIAPATTAYYDYNIKTSFPMYLSIGDFRCTWEALTETADMGRINRQMMKQGEIESNLLWFTTHRVAPIMASCFKTIRICNVALQNIGMLQDADQKSIDDLKAQAYFVRAYSHFALCRLWGGMPYITNVIGADDQWDLPRLSNYDTYLKIAADLDTAAQYFNSAGKMRRDPGPGLAGHLNDPEQARPNGVAAIALKSRVLLYAASPLSNQKGQAAWDAAAKASWEAIQAALQYQYDLLSLADYKKNFVGVKYTNEHIWAWNNATLYGYNGAIQNQLINGIFTANTGTTSGECPTQNFVDRFETKWGDPLNTEQDRSAAVSQGRYHDQNPYKDRDPRLGLVVLYNTAPLPGYGTAKIYYEVVNGSTTYGELLNPSYVGITRTGYYQQKVWGGQSTKNRVSTYYTDPLIRLTELYLNYAEAANEAYGPNAPAPGASMTAVDAINKVRARVGMVDMLPKFTADATTLRERIKNERTIELYGEGHHFYDIRRWKDAPRLMSEPAIGVSIEKVAVSPEYPTGYKYTRTPLSADRQVFWKSDAMYYFPFPIEEENKMNVFKPNTRW